MRRASLLAPLLAALAAGACAEDFSPVRPSDLQLSVFGYLDASADTQWIRVMPVRSLLLTSPGPFPAEVTLRHLGTGRVVELRDSVFRFDHNPEIGSEGTYVHNFWTTERIDPGASYRFSAALPGGEPSEAVVEVSPDYEVEVWIDQRANRLDTLRVVGVKHVAFASVSVRAYDGCGLVEARFLLETGSSESGVHMIPITAQVGARNGCGSLQIERRELSIVGSGAAWPTGGAQSAARLGLLDFPSNISDAVGFLGGVLTKEVLYETCRIESAAPSTDPCRLRYDEASAGVSGRVTDAQCGGGVGAVTVELREVDLDAAGRRKIRSAISGAGSGEFEIGALEAGKRYALRVFLVSPDPFRQYEPHTDTLELARGERRTYDVALRRPLCGR